MLRKAILGGIGALTAAIMLMGTAGDAQAFFDDPYIPFCRGGYCGGGDFYIGCKCRCGCPQRGLPCRHRYDVRQGGPYGSGNGTFLRQYQTTPPMTPSENQPPMPR